MKKGIINTCLIVFIIVFLGSAAYLVHYFIQADETQKELQELTELKVIEEITEEEKQEAKEKGIDEKYIRLHKKNSDMMAWIRIPDTRIDYPVMQNKNEEEYYLHRNFKKEEDKNGLPFLTKRCDILDVNSNFLVYGHHMKSGMMFTDLMKYKEESFFRNHKEISFDTIYSSDTYRVFAAFYTDVTEGSKHFKFYEYDGSMDKELFDKYVKKVTDASMHPVEEVPQFGQTLLTLVTCSYHT
nr:class B sortase [Eubacterium sp.]